MPTFDELTGAARGVSMSKGRHIFASPSLPPPPSIPPPEEEGGGSTADPAVDLGGDLSCNIERRPVTDPFIGTGMPVHLQHWCRTVVPYRGGPPCRFQGRFSERPSRITESMGTPLWPPRRSGGSRRRQNMMHTSRS